MNNVCKTLYSDWSRFHSFMYEKLSQLGTHARHCSNPQELADIGYTIREMEKLCDDTHKQLRSMQETIDQLLCMIGAAQQERTYRTEYTTATLERKMQAAVPKRSKDPEAYNSLCASLGIPAEVIEAGIADIRWPELCEHLTNLTRAEKPLPPGIDPAAVSIVYRVTYRGKRKPNEEKGAGE